MYNSKRCLSTQKLIRRESEYCEVDVDDGVTDIVTVQVFKDAGVCVPKGMDAVARGVDLRLSQVSLRRCQYQHLGDGV